MAPRKTKPTELASFGPPVGAAYAAPALPGVPMPSADETTPTEDRRARELEEILETLGTDGQVIVYHVINGKTTYAGSMTMDGFSLASLMDNYGGGDKTLVFMQGNKRVDTVRVPLDPSIPITSPRAKEMARNQASASVPATSAPSNGGFDVASLITAQATQFSAMMQASNQQNALMMNTLMGVLTLQASNKSDPTETIIKVMALMKENGGGGVGAEQIMSLVEKGMAIGARMNGDGDDVMGVVSKGLDTLGTLVTAMVNKPRTPAPALPVPGSVPVVTEGPLTGIVRDGPVNTQHEETVMARNPAPVIRPWVDALRPYVGMIVGAVGRMEPDKAADVLVAQLDEAEIDDMVADIKAPDFAGRLQSYFPHEITAVTEVQGGAEWLGAVLESVLEYSDEDEDAAPEGARDIPPATSNGTP